MSLEIVRKKLRKGFRYEVEGVTVTDNTSLDRIKSLAIPPAWTEVEISKSDGSRIQAKGRDAKGRLQYIYHPAYKSKQSKQKFNRIVEFAEKLPKLRKRLEKDLARKKFDKRKVLACAVSLMDETYMRIGNEQYAAENNSYGLTTLRSKHVTVKSSKIILDYDGKSGQHQHKEVNDEQLARLIRKLDNMPGYQLFRYYDENGYLKNLMSSDVNDYIKEIMGEDYTAKDFRTWGGTLKAFTELAYIKKPKNESECKKAIASCVKKVAKKLGNTPAIARGSYIDPRLLQLFEKQGGFHEMEKTFQKLRRTQYLNHEEQKAISLLSSA